jgi:hypothetical protein
LKLLDRPKLLLGQIADLTSSKDICGIFGADSVGKDVVEEVSNDGTNLLDFCLAV